MSRVYIVAALSVCHLAAVAQPDTTRIKRSWQRADSMLVEKYYAAQIDTNYIERSRERLTLKTRFNVSGATIEAKRNSEETFLTRCRADYKGTVSMAATYMGITLGLAINPGALTGRYKDYELNINSYGNKLGYEIIFQHAKNFRGWMQRGDNPKTELPRNLLTVRTLNMNVYYAFNNQRFSYPAAFSQSYLQKRSAGSWMLAASFQGQYIHSHEMEQLSTRSVKLQVVNWGIGGGYGYNLVLPHQWLFHLSSLPTFIVVSRNKMWIDDDRQSVRFRFPEVIITGRGAVVHSWKKYFAGASMVFNFTTIGSEKQLQVSNTKWLFRTFIGMRL